MKLFGLLMVVFLSIFISADSRADYGMNSRQVGDGVWGGNHVEVSVENGEARIDFDCSTAVINGPFTVGRNGQFSLKGTFTKGMGGPVRKDSQPKQKPARFTGTVRGDTMTLN